MRLGELPRQEAPPTTTEQYPGGSVGGFRALGSASVRDRQASQERKTKRQARPAACKPSSDRVQRVPSCQVGPFAGYDCPSE